ncbi:macrocin O-methyltransferase [Candidatus Pelagibacter sp.]|nr:macrocin O-methyltransferase [Candidatus Pelagibacter sp.]|tara:strand:+ start:116 stop:877 length:762 start_codon:yes stop_codon:yes gene_type:complete
MNLIKKLEKYEYLANIFENDIHNLNSSSLRFFYKYIINNINKIEGDILDLGVYRGRSLITTAIILKKLRSKKKVYGFDTFSGFPKIDKFDLRHNFKNDKYFSKTHLNQSNFFWNIKNTIDKINYKVTNISSSKNFSDSSLKFIKNKIKLLELDNIEIIKGDVIKTIPIFFKKNYKKKIMAINFDLDLYQPYKIALPFVWKNLSKGGYIHLDEFYSLKFPGPRIATTDFLKKNNLIVKYNKTRKGEFIRCYIKK